MHSTDKLTSTHQLLHAAAAMTQADDGLDYLDNLHVLARFPDGLRDQAEAAIQVLEHVGIRNPSDRELLVATIMAVQGARIEDLSERVARLELEESAAKA